MLVAARMHRLRVFACSVGLVSICFGQPAQPLVENSVKLSLERPAMVGMPVWLSVSATDRIVSYPFHICPACFLCDEVEVRRDGRLLPRIASLESQGFDGIWIRGNVCGSLSLPSATRHQGRIPLHLQYRFDQPGAYEVGYSYRYWRSEDPPTIQSAWSRIDILPGGPRDRAQWLAEMSAQAPDGTTDLLTDFLPSILGIPDAASFQLLLPYLYHQDNSVRRFAMYGLTYWPVEQAATSVMQLVRTRGPSEVAVRFLVRGAKSVVANYDGLIESAIPYLRSDSALLLQGAVAALQAVNLMKGSQVSEAVRIKAADALIGAGGHIADTASSQTANDYASALGSLDDPRAHEALWRLVNRYVARQEAAIALTWHPSAADLPKLADLALAPGGGELDRELSILPYHLHRACGDASLPFFEKMLSGSTSIGVRTQSARELVLAGRPSGFAFMADAIEHGRRYRAEMIQFLRDQFPELRQADEARILSIVQARATTK
jgi:hypothetical protein